MKRKGMAVWVSWVLIMGFAVSMGVFFFAWVRGFAADSSGDISERSELITLCESSSVRVKQLCQDAQTLNMNVSNNNNLRTDELLLRFYTIYEEPEVRAVNFTLRPGETRNIRMIKQGIMKQAEVIPVINKDGKRIVCESKRVTLTSIPIC